MCLEDELKVVRERYESMNITDNGRSYVVRYMYDGLRKKTYFDYNADNAEVIFKEAKAYRDDVYWDSIRTNTGYKHIKIDVNDSGGISVKAVIDLKDGKMIRKFLIKSSDEYEEAFNKAMFIVSNSIDIVKPKVIDYEIGLKHLTTLKFRVDKVKEESDE